MKTNKLTLSSSILLLALLVSACSGGSGSAPEETEPTEPAAQGEQPEQPEQPAEPALPEEATIRILTENSTAWPPKEDWGVWKWVKEETNITVKQELMTGPESLALAISSGDMPDILSVFPSEVSKYGPQGAFVDLSQHMDKMPNVKAFLDAHPGVKERVVTPTGEIYSIINDGAGEGSQMVWFYRDDIFAKHNLQVPKTWDELYTVSKQLKELYPDSYPFMFRHGIGTLDTFGPSFNFYPEIHPDPADPTKVKFGLEDPNAKTLVETLGKFLAEELIPPDWLTMDYKAWTQFMSNNQAFITVQFIGQIEIMNNQLPEGQHLKFMPPPIGVGDKPYLPRGGTESYGMAVASTSKNMDAAFRYLDYVFSEKGKDIQSWGKEGETYTVVDGKRKFNDNYKEPNDLRIISGIQTAATYGWFDFNAWLSLVKESEQEAYVEAPKYRHPVAYSRAALTPDEAAAVAPLNDQIWKFWTGEVAKFIYGERPMSEWETFVADLSKNGLNEIKATYQAALDRQIANTK
ncbi:extracellular solute-binding protein [Paenibacillus antri]|uniref:Extracellular solute-binding protein n=1 Tax=Paenibacillus antri TaxID=2582848 RepID=A0A5R9G136_9BACL|nr:extracellular solute-binding protein [Paenibacillus antri]TLS50042.1 extracellular solute-binding protein [Paenibacillus antri]